MNIVIVVALSSGGVVYEDTTNIYTCIILFIYTLFNAFNLTLIRLIVRSLVRLSCYYIVCTKLSW